MPYGASAADAAAGDGKDSPVHEQSTVVRLGADSKGITSVQVAAAPHTSPPSEQRKSRVPLLRIGCLLEAQACTFISRACSGAVPTTAMSAPLCSSSHGGSSVSISEVNAKFSVSTNTYGPSGAEQLESVCAWISHSRRRNRRDPLNCCPQCASRAPSWCRLTHATHRLRPSWRGNAGWPCG
eukprot:scaffold665_cov77-Phaeocystis_antarctica.AAC.3